MTKLFKKDGIVLIILLILFSLYAAVFIYKTSFVIDGERYYCLFDDAMISMRYAQNMVDGNGLVMNPGERVEGYTNPLWVFYMAAAHLLPVSQAKISLIIQITGALFLLVNLVFVRKIALLVSNNSQRVAVASIFLTAFYLPLINWGLQGMEVSIQTLIMSIAVWRTILAIRNGKFPLDVYFLLGINTFVRIDMAIPYLGIWIFLMAVMPGLRRKHLLWGGFILALFLGSQTIFRLIYYGDLLPNTYYLKMTGYPILLRITRGLYVWWNFILGLNPLFFLVPVVALVLAYEQSRGLLALVVGLQMLYSIYVGGDAWDDMGGSNRYIAFVMPEFFVLLACGLSLIKNFITSTVEKIRDFHNKAGRYILKYHFIFLIILGFIQFNSNNGSLSLSGLAFIRLPMHVEQNRESVERALLMKRITTPDARIAITWAGAFPYFSERLTVDILGKNDRTIARTKMRTGSGWQKLTFFHPGHLKYDPAYSFGELKPDAVIQFWGELEESEPYIYGKYTNLVVNDRIYYLRDGSEKIIWNKFMTKTPAEETQ
ncbi:MAG: hypothetical protein HOC71_02720 [Candidatus Latescibacteria bacterium]|jgi:hypothetical protein|nr:hypothetical protein [Candidatus Latescibacterota bacterium]